MKRRSRKHRGNSNYDNLSQSRSDNGKPANPLDDIPINNKNMQKTFEQMVEEELAREAKSKLSKISITMDPDEVNHLEEKRSKTPTEHKKSYLKRKNETAQKSQTSTTKKNYKYYVDNFAKKPEPHDGDNT